MTSDPVPDVAVIGGGAAGTLAAIVCAEAAPGRCVVVLEAAARPLVKVGLTGGGRCNLTHACFDPAALVTHYPRGGQALRGAFARFQPRDTLQWFSEHGLPLEAEPDGRVFPADRQAATIVEGLLRVARSAGVTWRLAARVAAIESATEEDPAPRFRITLEGGECLAARRVLLATGGEASGFELARRLGHTIEPPVPSLFTLALSDPRLASLAGVTVPEACLTLAAPASAAERSRHQIQQRGAVLITHEGLSGPAVLALSAWGARVLHACGYRALVRVNWVGGLNAEQVRQALAETGVRTPARRVVSYCPFAPAVPQRLWERLTAHAGLPAERRWSEVSREACDRLVRELTAGEFQIAGKGAFKEEFVTCGGVRLAEVDFKTMASRACPGLYLAGEVLDIDGLTGGFNLQSAWTTGWITGRALAEAMTAG